MYPCKGCLLKNICSENCHLVRFTAGALVNFIIKKKRCPFCGQKVYRTNKEISNAFTKFPHNKKYRCRSCDRIFTTLGGHSAVVNKYSTGLKECIHVKTV